MNDFDALLKRSFAEAHEPADDGFSAKVEHAVARRETAAKIRAAGQNLGLAVAGLAVLYGAYGMAQTYAPEFWASLGLGVARAHATFGGPANEAIRAVSAGLTQILLIAGALAGGLAAYRATQD
jgi:hypothetical protein